MAKIGKTRNVSSKKQINTALRQMIVVFADNIICTIILLLVLKYFTLIFVIDFLDPIQNSLSDFYISDIVFSKIRNNDKIPIDTNVVLVNIGYLNRAGIAKELDIINRQHPKVIAVDAFFRGDKSMEVDSTLMEVLSKIKNLVLVNQLLIGDDSTNFSKVSNSCSKFTQYGNCGYANILVTDNFQTVRYFSPKEIVNKKTYYAFATETARLYNKTTFDELLKRNYTNEIINYKRNQNRYLVYDINDIFANKKDLSAMKNKIVLLGFLGPNLSTCVTEDNFYTPMNSQYVGKTYPDMYGAVIHANCISMILSGDYIGQFPKWYNMILLILLIYFNMALYSYLRIKYETFYEVVSVSLTIVEALFFFTIMVAIFYFLDYSIYNNYYKAIFFALLITPMTFEGYHDSLKPLLISLFKKISLSKNKKK